MRYLEFPVKSVRIDMRINSPVFIDKRFISFLTIRTYNVCD